MQSLKTIIVDDEELARLEIRFLIAEYPEISVVGEAESISQAIQLVKEFKPDLIFLDIQLGSESGFDLLEKFRIDSQIVFVTAYDEYAIRAFEVNALDYLLKPVNPKRLTKTIERLLSNQNSVRRNIKKLKYDDRVYINTDRTLKFLEIKTIECICADRDYSQIIDCCGKKSVVLKTLKKWEEILPINYFNRIHRSTIVNNEYIENIEPWFNYTYRVYLRNIKEPFCMSRRYAAKLKGKLNF